MNTGLGLSCICLITALRTCIAISSASASAPNCARNVKLATALGVLLAADFRPCSAVARPGVRCVYALNCVVVNGDRAGLPCYLCYEIVTTWEIRRAVALRDTGSPIGVGVPRGLTSGPPGAVFLVPCHLACVARA